MDGFGRYGIVQETGEGLVCHVCGRCFTHLGLHVWRGHGVTAAVYRREHGLPRSRGLVVADLRRRQAVNAAGSPATAFALAAARDPALATAARVALDLPAAAAAAADRDRRIAATGSARLGRVTVCQGCGVQFCALHGSARRRFCGLSCASRAHQASRANRALSADQATEATDATDATGPRWEAEEAGLAGQTRGTQAAAPSPTPT